MDNAEATRRLHAKKQTLDDAYAAPANFLEIDVINPLTHGDAKKRFTDYEVRMRVTMWQHLRRQKFNFYFSKTNLPVFKIKESSVRRRYSDFEWLRSELERDSKVKVRVKFTVFQEIQHLSLTDSGASFARKGYKETTSI